MRFLMLTILASFLLASTAHAGWEGSYRTITQVYPHDGGVTFNLDGPTVIPSAPCGNRFIILGSAPNYSAKVAALLSLHAQGKRLQINYDSASTNCDITVYAFISEN